jgi:CBS domain-containing protein
MESEPPTAKSELLMAIAGPIASLVISGICYLIAAGGDGWPAPVVGVISYLALINLILAIFNMLPAFPLDGGRVLRAALWGHWQDFTRATRLASRIGLWAGAAFMMLGAAILIFLGSAIGGIWWFVIGLFLRGSAQAEMLRLELSSVMTDHTVGDFMSRDPVSVPAGTTLSELISDYVYRHHFGAYPVVDGKRAVGLIGIKHIRGVRESEWPTTTVDEVMTPLTQDMLVAKELPAMEALLRLQRDKEKRLIVAEGHSVIGILTLSDLMTVVGLMMEMRLAK